MVCTSMHRDLNSSVVVNKQVKVSWILAMVASYVHSFKIIKLVPMTHTLFSTAQKLLAHTNFILLISEGNDQGKEEMILYPFYILPSNSFSLLLSLKPQAIQRLLLFSS